VRSSGTLFCLVSASAFGSMAIFGKLSYEGGATVGTLLVVRFAIAALLFWTLVLAVRETRREALALRRRDLAVGLALGGIGYSLQSGCFFAALQRIDASLLALVLYTFPAMVAVAAVALGRERLNGRKVTALVCALSGLGLVVAGAGTGTLDALGIAFGLAAAIVYTTYILVSQGAVARMSPPLLSALVCTGAVITLVPATALLGDLHPSGLAPAGWGWIACIAVVCTFAAVSLFFAGLKRVGPTTASILATVEPPVTLLLAFLVFGETLGPVQILGAALVLSAVFVLNARLSRVSRTTLEPAAEAA
jgi:drug/metabolite transporter (DMT)-like permease